MPYSPKKLMLVTLFGVVISIFETVLPTPVDKLFTVVQATLLSLGYLMLGASGATYISLVGGVLTTISRMHLAVFTLLFSSLYGLSIDTFSSLLKVRTTNGVRSKRLILAVTSSTAIVGLTSYLTSTFLGLIPLVPEMGIAILILGIISGSLGGWMSLLIWKRILRTKV